MANAVLRTLIDAMKFEKRNWAAVRSNECRKIIVKFVAKYYLDNKMKFFWNNINTKRKN